MLTKKAYLNTVRDRISCDADGEMLWDAYQGSEWLLRLTWGLYEKRGRQFGVSPEVAGYMMQNGLDKKTASAAMGVLARRVVD